jgi:hypothetical protein
MAVLAVVAVARDLGVAMAVVGRAR